jgi:hypothetical protein
LPVEELQEVPDGTSFSYATPDGVATDFEVLDLSSLPSRKTRGPYKKEKRPPAEEPFEVLELEEMTDFEDAEVQSYVDELEVVEADFDFDSLPKLYTNSRDIARQQVNKPVCFIDGEGANNGERSVTIRRKYLRRWVQKQNYALLGIVYRNIDTPEQFEYRCIESPDHVSQLGTKQCLDFILSIPATHIIVGFALTYDVEMWLREIKGVKPTPEKPSPMEMLMRSQSLWWRGYRLHYIPKKVFSVSKWKGKKKIAGRTIYDAHGFFQSDFKSAIRDWQVGTKEEWEFIDRMKDTRPDFGPITEEVKAYNRMEGIHGVQMFERVRTEYTNLGLKVPRPVGAGSIASAVFRKHNVLEYFPSSPLLPVDITLSAFFGGRFDITRIGFVGDIIESDINSAYPFIARNLPCLHCGRYVTAHGYEPEPNSLWLVRWKDNGTRWSPFPYRTEGGHIRYYANGIGWYYDAEVAEALQFDPTIDVLAGFKFQANCEHQPFGFVDDYYRRREEMKRTGDFGEKIIKLGLNSIYGKLSQSKGKNPPFQQWILAGLITGGTRALLMSGIRQNPEAVVKVATDAVFSTDPLDLDYHDTKLGAWKTETLYNLLVLGNGVYQSTGSSNPKTPNGVSKNRGFERGSGLRFNWNEIRDNYRLGKISVVRKYEFRRFVKAFHEKNLSERCDWIESEIELKLDVQKMKRREGEFYYPLPNPTPTTVSASVRINPENLKLTASLVDNKEGSEVANDVDAIAN